METRRLELLEGKLVTPDQIDKLVNHDTFERFFQALWHNYLMDPSNTTSSTYWSDEFNDHKAFNRALMHLSKAGWIESIVIPGRNWATVRLKHEKLLKWVTDEELIDIRKYFKFERYKMKDFSSEMQDMTKTPQGLQDVGIRRPGQMKAGNHKFRYDADMLHKHYDVILQNTIKSIEKAIAEHNLVLDGADYRSVACEVLDYHLYSHDEEFTLGAAFSDSRGRAISKALSKIFNPIGYKDARALLIGPEVSLGKIGFNQVYLAVSELLGCKLPTTRQRVSFGKQALENKTLLELDLSLESDRADNYENMWLERIYAMKERYNGHNWNVPIEIDATASVCQVYGTLLGDYPLCDETNIINPDELKDMWTKGMPRAQFKTATTPLLYGSTQHCTQLWAKKKIKYTAEQIKIHKKELSTGPLSVANAFKDFIIDNVEPKPEMRVKIGDEEFTIYCNKYMNVGDYVKKYPLYDTETSDVRTVNHVHTSRVADLEAFKRYFPTLLVHNRDSKVADKVCLKLSWVLPIYDAFIVMPDEGLDTRVEYANEIDDMYENREETLEEFFKSINIPNTVGVHKQWVALQKKITPIEKFKCAVTCLK